MIVSVYHKKSLSEAVNQKTRQLNGQKKKSKNGQTMICKSTKPLHRELKIEQHEPH